MTRARQEAKFWLVGLICATLYFGAPMVYRVYELQSVRETFGLIPFENVLVENQKIIDNRIILSGYMVKNRCEFVSLSAYVSDGRKTYRTSISVSDDEASHGSGNRPPGPQAWGPWEIKSSPSWEPLTWQVFAHHKCPEMPTEVITPFAVGMWRDME